MPTTSVKPSRRKARAPATSGPTCRTAQTVAYPGDFAGDIDGNFPRDLWYFTAGRDEGGDPCQLHLAVGQRRSDRPPQLRW